MMQYAYTPITGFRSEKAAQVSCKFVQLAQGQMDKLKLMKLLYLAERESVATRGRPMFCDEYFSMKDGPICSAAMNGVNGKIHPEIWSRYLHRNGVKDIFSVRGVTDEDLDQLSRSDMQIINDLYVRLGWMTASQIRNWTHEHCKEWVEVDPGKRLPIQYVEMAKALDIPDAEEVAARIDEYHRIEAHN